jgi:hypothetical protein
MIKAKQSNSKTTHIKLFGALICLFVELLAVGCSPKKDMANVQPQIKVEARPQITVKEELTIKGFTLGMDKADARAVLSNLNLDGVETNSSRFQVGIFRGPVTSDNGYLRKQYGHVVLVYDANDKLVHVEMFGAMVNHLFNVEDMDLKDFATKFANEYKIDAMEPFQRNTIHGWRYRDEENGVELVIYADSRPLDPSEKKITFHSIPKASDRKFN